MSAPTPAEWIERPVRITRDGVYFGEHKVPGCIAEDGVTLNSSGSKGINKLTITFLVREVMAEDPMQGPHA